MPVRIPRGNRRLVGMLVHHNEHIFRVEARIRAHKLGDFRGCRPHSSPMHIQLLRKIVQPDLELDISRRNIIAHNPKPSLFNALGRPERRRSARPRAWMEAPKPVSGDARQTSGDARQTSGDGKHLFSRAKPLSSRAKPLSSRAKPLSSRAKPLSSRPRQLSSRAKQLSSRPRRLSSRPRRLSSRPRRLSSRPRRLSSR